MTDRNDSVLDKAESLARRILERLGASFDSKLAPDKNRTLGSREVGEITSRIERVIESSLRKDKDGVKRIAPNRFKVLFTYEVISRLNPGYTEALAKELKATVFEFINNRRYETRGPIEVETGSDLFAKTTVIKADFEGDEDAAKPSGIPIAAISGTAPSVKRTPGQATIVLAAADGRSFPVELKSGGAPACIGRVAGNAIMLDHPSVSRMHCSFALRASGDVVIADLGSSNGTFVNGQLLGANESRPLNEGDVVDVGEFKLTVSVLSRQ